MIRQFFATMGFVLAPPLTLLDGEVAYERPEPQAIGRRFDEEVVQRDIKLVPYKIIKADNGDAWVEVRDQKYSAPEISAMVLQKMKQTAEDYLGEAVNDAFEIRKHNIGCTSFQIFLNLI